jgi:NADPH:quinone reductase-like Zn-dependent oxidoreductase
MQGPDPRRLANRSRPAGVPGCDVAGIVEEVGAGVLGFAPTDAVLGGIEAMTSSLAETIALIRDYRSLSEAGMTDVAAIP